MIDHDAAFPLLPGLMDYPGRFYGRSIADGSILGAAAFVCYFLCGCSGYLWVSGFNCLLSSALFTLIVGLCSVPLTQLPINKFNLIFISISRFSD
jgi:hypothetical protein